MPGEGSGERTAGVWWPKPTQREEREGRGQRHWDPDVDGRAVGLAGDRLMGILMDKYCW